MKTGEWYLEPNVLPGTYVIKQYGDGKFFVAGLTFTSAEKLAEQHNKGMGFGKVARVLPSNATTSNSDGSR